MQTKDQLIQQLKNLGLSPGDLVMLHASVRAVGNVLGGPDQIHQAIMEAIAPSGTLTMYVDCEAEYPYLGRGKYSKEEEKNIIDNCPAFNAETDRARRNHGILAEFFRSWPGVVCSENPGARMAALGEQSSWLVGNHPLNYGYGPGSPLAKLYENNGKILLLGSDLDQVTLFHYAEHIAPIKEKRIKKFKVPLNKNGKKEWVEIEEYDTSLGIRKWPDRFFETILKNYLFSQQIYPKKVGGADSYYIDAKLLVDFAIPIFVDSAEKYYL